MPEIVFLLHSHLNSKASRYHNLNSIFFSSPNSVQVVLLSLIIDFADKKNLGLIFFLIRSFFICLNAHYILFLLKNFISSE